MADSTPKDSLSKRRARGRRIAMTIYYTMVAIVGGAAAYQITRQVLFPPMAAPAQTSCRDAFRSLNDALSRAREAAAREGGGEDAAIGRFRAALDPEWAAHEGIRARCRGSLDEAGTLDAIERLRYAEEHAVRREAGELAPLRRKVQATVDQLGR